MLDPFDLIQNRGAANILVSLLERETLNVTQLSENAGVCSGTLQRRLDELKECELIDEEIRESENRRLEKAYGLTESGKGLSKHLASIKGVRCE